MINIFFNRNDYSNDDNNNDTDDDNDDAGDSVMAACKVMMPLK